MYYLPGDGTGTINNRAAQDTFNLLRTKFENRGRPNHAFPHAVFTFTERLLDGDIVLHEQKKPPLLEPVSRHTWGTWAHQAEWLPQALH